MRKGLRAIRAPATVRTVTEESTRALEERRVARLRELEQQGFRPSRGWLTPLEELSILQRKQPE